MGARPETVAASMWQPLHFGSTGGVLIQQWRRWPAIGERHAFQTWATWALSRRGTWEAVRTVRALRVGRRDRTFCRSVWSMPRKLAIGLVGLFLRWSGARVPVRWMFVRHAWTSYALASQLKMSLLASWQTGWVRQQWRPSVNWQLTSRHHLSGTICAMAASLHQKCLK